MSKARWGLSRKLCMVSIISSYCWTLVLCLVQIPKYHGQVTNIVMLHCVTLCYMTVLGRSVSGGSGWIPSWFVQSLPTSTERSQKLCGHLTTSLAWGTSTPWNELVPNTLEHLECTCLESRSKKSKAV